MKAYEKEIINRLLDIYERRGSYKKRPEEIRAISIEITKAFPEYADSYNHSAYPAVNAAVESLIRKKLVTAKATERGSYEKIRFSPDHAEDAYTLVKRKPLGDKFGDLTKVLSGWHNTGIELLDRIVSDFQFRADEGKKIPYGIEFDAGRLQKILMTLSAVLTLQDETYVRNLSNALFKDSKTFQKDYKTTIQSILYDYTETSVEKDRILEVYNLYENPTYVLLKGDAVISSGQTQICLRELTGGIAIPEKALEDIKQVIVRSPRIITVENLTTFHDCTDDEDLYIYLGGFHNRSKEKLLKMIYTQNPDRTYLHKGDLDVYGFAILESLKARTNIPFSPLEMDVETLRKYYEAGLYKELSPADKKLMDAPALQQYKDVFQFMITHNCKVEQESKKAVLLIKDKKNV